MQPERWRQIERLYHAALERPLDLRRAFLLDACAGDGELQNEVESLLARAGGQFLKTESEITPMQTGTQVGPYKLETPLGAGGMGEVFRALDTRLGRTVAIKFLRRETAADPRHRSRFLQEARAASALNHPNIVILYDISCHEGIDFLVMEYVPGQTLKDLISPDGMPLENVLHLGSQVALALAAAHASGVVHRDIKPANIMVTSSGQAKVLDFGLARMMPQPNDETVLPLTQPGMVMGTVSYMSPEQTRGEDLDGRSDIFSLGCVLYHAITGQLPFRGESMLSVMDRIATATPSTPSDLRADVPQSLDRLIAACLEKNPARRPASAAEVAKSLKSISESLGGPAVGLTSDPTVVRGDHRRSVAVVPFRFRTALADDRFLSVALAESVVNRLGAAEGLLVRPIASVLRYAAADVDCAQVARELNVDVVVEGTIQKMGAKLRVLVQALQPGDSRILHSSRHDGDMEDLFGLQDRIGDAVSGALVIQPKAAPETAIPPTRNPLAYELYMRAADRVVHMDKFDTASAIEMLCRAVEIDPNFADAWGRLAQAYANMGSHLDPHPQWFDRAEHAIAMTLELDPVQCDALCARAQTLWSPSRGFQNRPALRAINAALKVNPNRPVIRMFRGAILFHLGYYDQAERDTNESMLANPGYAMGITGQAMIALFRGDYEAANHFYERVLALDPAQVLGNIFAPLPALYLGRMDEAREKVRKARQMVPQEPQLTGFEALFAAHEGNFAKADELADSACSANQKSVTHTHHTWHTCAGVYALIGRPEKALAQLRRCGEMGLPNYRLFNSDPCLSPLRDLPEFTALMSNLRRQHDEFRSDIDPAT